MSRTTERVAEELKESEFRFLDGRTFEIRNAVMFWTNFRGEANRFGNSARSFNLALTEEVAQVLQEGGWKVRSVEYGEGGVLYFVNIKVNMDSAYPPIVNLYSEFRGKRGKVTLGVDNIADLDRVNIQSADCIVNAYTSKAYPGKVTGYLKKLNVIQEPDVDFGGKYDDWLSEEPESAPENGNIQG